MEMKMNIASLLRKSTLLTLRRTAHELALRGEFRAARYVETAAIYLLEEFDRADLSAAQEDL
jgi:hypothetical protein